MNSNPITVSLDGLIVHELSSIGIADSTKFEGYTYITGRVDGQPKIVNGKVKDSYLVILGDERREYVVYETSEGPEFRRLFREGVSEAYDLVAKDAA